MAYALTKLVCWLFFRFRCGFEVTGQAHVPARGPFILAANHVSFLDPPVVGTACPRRVYFMARADLFRRPLLGLFMRSVGVIPLRRGEADVTAMREALEHLRQGLPVAIFPEGGRQRSGQIGTAKRGVGVLAELAQAPIVPAYVAGTYEALPPTATRVRRAKIRVAFGAPISYTHVSLPPVPPPGGALAVPERLRRRQALADAVTASWSALAAQMGQAAAPTPTTTT